MADDSAEKLDSLLSPKPSFAELEDAYSMSHLTPDRKMLKRLLLHHSTAVGRFAQKHNKIQSMQVVFDASTDSISYALIYQDHKGNEQKHWFPHVFRNLKDQFGKDADIRIYFASQGCLGNSYSIVHNGTIQCFPTHHVEHLQAETELNITFLHLIRWQMFKSVFKSVGIEISREVLHKGAATFLCDIFMPMLLGGSPTPDSAANLYQEENFRHLSNIFRSWQNRELDYTRRYEARRELRQLFPKHVCLDNVNPDCLYFMTWGGIQLIEPEWCLLPHLRPPGPPLMHGGHRLPTRRNRFSRTFTCRREFGKGNQ